MLAPKTSSWVGGQGSYGALRWEDWVHQCGKAGLSDAATRFGWLKYAEHLTLDQVLAASLVYKSRSGNALRKRIQELAIDAIKIGKGLEQRQNWGKPLEAPKMIRFCELALAEALVDCKCRKCQGRSQMLVRGVIKPCPACNGAGSRSMSGAERAILVGMCDRNWRMHWRSRYESVLDAIRQWDHDLNRALRLGGG